MPRGIRNVAVVCLILSALVGYWAAAETWMLFRLEDATEVKTPWLWQVQDPEIRRQVQEREQEAQHIGISALSAMRDARAMTLTALSIACALTFVGASRILRPFGLPREGVRRLLGGAALAAGVLRTIDGAQWAVVGQKEAVALGKSFATLPAAVDTDALRLLAPWMPGIGLGAAILQTLVVAGAFLIVSQYFRSERVKKIVAFRDSHPE